MTVAKATFRGAVIGALIFLPGVALAAGVAGSGRAGALALAAFAGVWGGVGFGAMLGGVLHLARQEELERQETPPAGDRSAPPAEPIRDLAA